MDKSIHPIFCDRPSADTKLWRYLSLAKFAALLQSSRLHFTRVDQFDDHFEGAFPLRDLQAFINFSTANRCEQILGLPCITEGMKRTSVAASCWIEGPQESAAMWRLYAAGKEGVAVATSFANLEAATCQFKSVDINYLAGAGRVKYIDHFNYRHPGFEAWNLVVPFMLKNSSYQHEREVRALIVAPHSQPIPTGGCDIGIDLKVFIDEIVVNPFAQTWFIDAVEGIADQFGLKMKCRKSRLSKDLFYGNPKPFYFFPRMRGPKRFLPK